VRKNLTKYIDELQEFDLRLKTVFSNILQNNMLIRARSKINIRQSAHEDCEIINVEQ
jgi:hypothetical protein